MGFFQLEIENFSITSLQTKFPCQPFSVTLSKLFPTHNVHEPWKEYPGEASGSPNNVRFSNFHLYLGTQPQHWSLS